MQAEVARVLEGFADEPVAQWGVDGCLAPTPVLSIAGFARAVGRAVRTEPRLLAAARTAPWAIDEPDGENAVVIDETGALAKTGAGGVVVVALETGDSVAVKVLDGDARPAPPVALAVLERAGLIPDGPAGGSDSQTVLEKETLR